MRRTIEVRSQHAQYITQRSFRETIRALYAINVVLLLIGNEDEADKVHRMIAAQIAEVSDALRREQERLQALADDNGGVETPAYTNPKTLNLNVSTPQMGQFLGLVEQLDDLLVLCDGLWFAQIITNRDKKRITHDFRRKVYAQAREIIALNAHARKAIREQGRQEEMDQADAERDASELVSGSAVEDADSQDAENDADEAREADLDEPDDQASTTSANDGEDAEPEPKRRGLFG